MKLYLIPLIVLSATCTIPARTASAQEGDRNGTLFFEQPEEFCANMGTLNRDIYTPFPEIIYRDDELTEEAIASLDPSNWYAIAIVPYATSCFITESEDTPDTVNREYWCGWSSSDHREIDNLRLRLVDVMTSCDHIEFFSHEMGGLRDDGKYGDRSNTWDWSHYGAYAAVSPTDPSYNPILISLETSVAIGENSSGVMDDLYYLVFSVGPVIYPPED